MAKVDKHQCLTDSGEEVTIYTRSTRQSEPPGNGVFYAMDYFATGEGRTLMFLIEDASNSHRSMQDFVNFCGPYYSANIEQLSQEDFLTRYGGFLPPHVEMVLKQSGSVVNMKLLQELHFNLY